MTEHASTGDVDATPREPPDGEEPASDPASAGLETRVDDPDAVAASCRYCGRPFASTAAHDLHVGDAHAEACTDREREAHERAADAEDESLFYFHLRVVAALAALYTVLVLLYMVALGSGLL